MTVRNENGANELPGLTNELVAELEKDRSKVAQLNERQLRELIQDEDEPGTTPVAPKAEASGVIPNASVVPAIAAPSAPAPVKDGEKPALDAVDGEEYRKKSDALNVARQEVDKRTRELEEARRLSTENQTRADGLKNLKRKTLDEEGYIESVEERLQRLEDENKSLREGNAAALGSRVETLDSEVKRAAVQREFLEIETFQIMSPKLGADLRTQRSIRDIDTDVSKLEGLLGKDNVLKMQTDKAYREAMAGQGYTLPPEWEKWQVVMNLHKFKKGGNSLNAAYPTYNSAFVEFAQESGYLKKAVSDAGLEAARQTAEKLITRSTETSLLPTESGSGGGSHIVSSDKWTQEKAKAWMGSHRTPKTDEERRTQYEILAWLETQPDID